ncbi:MAG: thiamine-phosphate kinase, partial [Nitrososphaera sp.]|uniref:thiamine-phosphate kinase n=1 Tax=Nitrososphaera sp. TaxID=1971748 RepID=UPI003D6E6BA5
IRIISSALGIGDLDDVATVAVGRQRLVFKSDMLVGSTDVPAQMKPWQIARKSVVSCASDLAAKGARPVAAMISLGLPKGVTESYVEGLAKGFQLASREFGVKIVGGDTNETCGLVIDCSMIGVAGRGVPARSGARPGDAVVISGRFGYPSAGLALLLKGARSAGQFRRHAVDSVLEPKPRQQFGAKLARFFTSSIDSSDGLAASLYEIAVQSNVNIIIDYESAKALGVDEFALANGLDAKELVFHGGEEYEIVATMPRSAVSRAKAAAKKARLELHVIGKVTKGGGNVHAGKSLLENRGYAHFT